MAPNQHRNTDKGQFRQKGDHDYKDNHMEAEVEDRGDKMTLVEKLMFSAALWGIEACNNFEQLYTMPVLQTLGLPLSLVSLTGGVAGPSATLLLFFLGWVSDRGSDPHHRKVMASIFVTCVLTCGMMCVLVANVLHLTYLTDYNSNIANNDSGVNSVTVTTGHSMEMSSHSFNTKDLAKANMDHDLDLSENMLDTDSGLAHSVNGSVNPAMTYLHQESSGVPFKAGLALLGFILMDMGIDTCSACVKSYVLTSGPRSEHTSLLVIGLIMASAGGVSTAGLGLLDFTSILGLTDIQGARLTIQTTVQGVVIIFFLVLGLVISLLTGRRRVRLQNTLSKYAQPTSEHSEISLHSEEQVFRGIITDTFENSIRSFGGGAVHFDQNLVLLDEHQRSILPDLQDTPHNLPTERTPLLCSEEVLKENKSEMERSHLSSFSVSFGDRDTVPDFSAHPTADKRSLEDLPEDKVMAFSRQSSGSVGSFKVNILLITIAIYFSTAVILLFTMTSSDYVGKAIYGGDPEAPPGSKSLAQYQEGISMASWGFFAYYASYLLISFVHHQILALLGHRLEFISVQLLMAASLLAATLTARLETYFVLTVVAGLQRACFFVVPFAVTNDIVQSMASQTGDGRNRVGFVTAMVTAALPVAYCTLYPWTGPLEDLTGQPAIPFWAASCSGLISAFAFLALRKI